MKLELSGVGFADHQHRVEEPDHPPHGVADAIEVLLLALLVPAIRVRLEELGRREDDAERRPELVRGDRDEAALQLDELPLALALLVEVGERALEAIAGDAERLEPIDAAG